MRYEHWRNCTKFIRNKLFYKEFRSFGTSFEKLFDKNKNKFSDKVTEKYFPTQ